jgi:hypothetical protein
MENLKQLFNSCVSLLPLVMITACSPSSLKSKEIISFTGDCFGGDVSNPAECIIQNPDYINLETRKSKTYNGLQAIIQATREGGKKNTIPPVALSEATNQSGGYSSLVISLDGGKGFAVYIAGKEGKDGNTPIILNPKIVSVLAQREIGGKKVVYVAGNEFKSTNIPEACIQVNDQKSQGYKVIFETNLDKMRTLEQKTNAEANGKAVFWSVDGSCKADKVNP